MNEYAWIAVIGGFILLVLLVLAPKSLMKWTGQTVVKLTIGACLLFLLNVTMNRYGVDVPINLLTTSISGFLGLPGVAALAVIKLYIL